MSAFTGALGNLAGDAGKAFVQQREFDMQSMLGQAQTEQARANADYLRAHANSVTTIANRDKWQPMGNAPVLNPKTGDWEFILRNSFDGSIQRVPAGAPASSLQSVMMQLQNSLPDNFPQLPPEQQARLLFGTLFKATTGSASTMTQGLHPTTVADANGLPVAASQDLLNNTVTPSGGAAKKPVPNNYQVVTDANGNQVLVTVPKFSGAGANKPQQPTRPVPPASMANMIGGAGATMTPAPSPSVNGVGKGTGLIKKPAMLSTEAANMLRSLQSANPLITDLVSTLEKSNRQGDGGMMDAVKSRYEWGKYKLGLPTDDPFYQKAFATADLYRNIITGMYAHGIRRGDLIEKIQQHMPTSGDTPALMYQKAKLLQQLNPQIEAAIVDFEKQRVQGLGAFTGTPQPSQQATVPSPLQQYVGAKGVREFELSDGSVWHVGNGAAQQVKAGK